MSKLEVSTSRERAMNLTAGGVQEVVRVAWRAKGARRWSSFLIVPDEGQPLDELERFAVGAAEKVAEQRGVRLH